jgi:hypothetical protein
MASAWTLKLISVSALLLMLDGAALAQSDSAPPAETQTASASDAAADQPAPLTEDELEILVARIALYPDELIAVISAASLYPLQIVEASRFLDDYAKDSWIPARRTEN